MTCSDEWVKISAEYCVGMPSISEIAGMNCTIIDMFSVDELKLTKWNRRFEQGLSRNAARLQSDN